MTLWNNSFESLKSIITSNIFDHNFYMCFGFFPCHISMLTHFSLRQHRCGLLHRSGKTCLITIRQDGLRLIFWARPRNRRGRTGKLFCEPVYDMWCDFLEYFLRDKTEAILLSVQFIFKSWFFTDTTKFIRNFDETQPTRCHYIVLTE